MTFMMFKRKPEHPYNIVQIIRADLGWRATYLDEDKDELFSIPVACWALFEHSDGWRYVEGMTSDPDGLHPAESSNFRGYSNGPDLKVVRGAGT